MIILPNEIHLWYASDDEIHDPRLLSRYFDLLSNEESAQQKRFHFDKHRHQYLITRAMVRSVLSLYANEISPENWEFTKNEYGKPSISNKSLRIPLRFNISHTDKLVILAIKLDQEVGVDVEYLPRVRNMVDIASHFFSISETKDLHGLPIEKQANRIFDLWTLKEAYVKACGMGLSIPLDHFSYSFSQQGKISIDFEAERNDHPEYWQFWQVHPNNTHKISMAVKSDKLNTDYTVSMRNIVPLSKIIDVNYPITHGSVSSAPMSRNSPVY